MNKLSKADRCDIVAALVRGNSIRTVSQITGVARNTVNKLLVDLGRACFEYQNSTFRNLPCRRILFDQIWSFSRAKEKDLPRRDVWTWVARDADTKLVPMWYVGARDADSARHFIRDVMGRLNGGSRFTWDGDCSCLYASEDAFNTDIDYAMLVRAYGNASESPGIGQPHERGITRGHAAIGDAPAQARVPTQFAELQNLTKKVENHMHILSFHYMYYNFALVDEIRNVTPAMASGIVDHVWSLTEIIGLLDPFD